MPKRNIQKFDCRNLNYPLLNSVEIYLKLKLDKTELERYFICPNNFEIKIKEINYYSFGQDVKIYLRFRTR